MHDRRGAGEGADRDVDWPFGLQAANQLVVINDRLNISVVDRIGKLGRIVLDEIEASPLPEGLNIIWEK